MGGLDFNRLRSGPFEGPAIVIPPALLEDTYFAKVHKTLRVTPAMEAGIADHVWEIKEIVNLSDK